jgi:hypothetical protein
LPEYVLHRSHTRIKQLFGKPKVAMLNSCFEAEGNGAIIVIDR